MTSSINVSIIGQPVRLTNRVVALAMRKKPELPTFAMSAYGTKRTCKPR